MQLPPPQPEHMEVLRNNPPELISFQYFWEACYAYGHWQIACGVDPAELQNPATFVTEDDLNRFVGVVNNWPAKAPPKLRKPDLVFMVMCLRTQPNNPVRTFREQLEVLEGNILRWMDHNNIDPSNPNESAAERKARLNRERVKAYRQRHAVAKSEDPQEVALAKAVSDLALSVQAGRSWAKKAEADAKQAREAAIEAAKAHCATSISGFKSAVANEENRLKLAQLALDAYINK